MLVQSGSNRNHYQAEVNSSSSALQSSPTVQPLRSPAGHPQLWNNILSSSSTTTTTTAITTNSGTVISQISNSSLSPLPNPSSPPAEIDSFNNNNSNNNNLNTSGGPNNNTNSAESTYAAPDSPPCNDNECSSVFLSEVDLVASVNISLLKKGNHPAHSHSPTASALHSSSHRSSTLVTTSSTVVGPTVASSAAPSALLGASGLAGGSGVSLPATGFPGVGSSSNNNNNNNNTSSSSSDDARKVGSYFTADKMSDAYLSGVKPESLKNNNNNLRQGPLSAPNTPETMRKHQMLLRRDLPIISHSMYVPHVSAKKEKMEFNQMMMKMNERDRPLSYHGRSSESNSSPCILSGPVNKRHVGGGSSSAARTRKEAAMLNRRSMPSPYLENRFREKFDVSALDTNLPRIDLEAIENHLRLAREEERKRRSDREEIRRRLALESEDVSEKPSGRKPSLHSRLQSTSDSESPNSDTEAKHQQQPASLPHVKAQPVNGNDSNGGLPGGAPAEDFYARQARLQAEARQALSQAKEMARLQMAQEREQRLTSPITEMVKNSLLKVGVTLPPERRRVSRQLLTEMNVAQLQVIVNDLHTHIEVLNETLVSMLLERDDLHMEQDSMLVDIEDLTRYLAAKDNSPHQSLPLIAPSRNLLGKK